jgi:hypothetical protein
MKQKRIKDPMLLNSMRGDPCVICGLETSNAPHHYPKTKASGGGDVESNLIKLCPEHHLMAHNLGMISFPRKYKKVREWLEKWEYFDILDQL